MALAPRPTAARAAPLRRSDDGARFMPSAKVLVIGNCTLDVSFRVPRFPKPGETVLADGSIRDIGGKGANQAVAAARSGVRVELCAAVGVDENGEAMRARLSEEGVGMDHVAAPPVPTDESIIYVTPEGDNSIVSTHAAAAAVDMALARTVLEAAAPGDILLMQGNLRHDVTQGCLEEGRRRLAVTVLNPAPIQYGYEAIWPFVDCAILNEVESEHLTGSADPAAAAGHLVGRGVHHVVVTLGARGALLAQGESIREVPAVLVDAVDTTGAGDVFCGVFAASMAQGLAVEPATRGAVRAATLSVTRPGTQSAFPSRAEIEQILVEARDGPNLATH